MLATEVSTRGAIWNKINMRGLTTLPWLEEFFNHSGWQDNLGRAKSIPLFPFQIPKRITAAVTAVQSPIEIQIPSFLRLDALARLLRGHFIT